MDHDLALRKGVRMVLNLGHEMEVMKVIDLDLLMVLVKEVKMVVRMVLNLGLQMDIKRAVD